MSSGMRYIIMMYMLYIIPKYNYIELIYGNKSVPCPTTHIEI